MPISPERMKLYPGGSTRSLEWKAIRDAILNRAGNCCEGTPKRPECRAANGEPHPESGSKVVLTIGHMDHDVLNNSDENLRALCQKCHNGWDRPHRRVTSAVTRFMRFVSPEPNTGCWLWCGCIDKSGYGRLGLHGETTGAHRASYLLFKGGIPDGKFVCHSCDVRLCVNPDHLWLGTAQDNMDDCISKGRMKKGSLPGARNPSAILTEEQVQYIKSQPRTYGYARRLSQELGVSHHTIKKIAQGKTWRAA